MFITKYGEKVWSERGIVILCEIDSTDIFKFSCSNFQIKMIDTNITELRLVYVITANG